MNRPMVGWVDRWMDGWTGGLTDGRTNRKTDIQGWVSHLKICAQANLKNQLSMALCDYNSFFARIITLRLIKMR